MSTERLNAREIVQVLRVPEHFGEDDEIVAARKWIAEKYGDLIRTPRETDGKMLIPGAGWAARESHVLWLEQQLDDLRESFFCSQCQADPDGFSGHCAGCGRVF